MKAIDSIKKAFSSTEITLRARPKSSRIAEKDFKSIRRLSVFSAGPGGKAFCRSI
jgi:hypothetical protein